MYSQNNEETHILAQLKHIKKGRFLDLGAADGRTFSNTLALAELGWSGVCVEAQPNLSIALRDTHRSRPAVLCLEAAIVPESRPEGPVTFYDIGDLVSSLSKEHTDKWKTAVGRDASMRTVTGIHISTLCNEVTGEFSYFDFVNIDVEGCSVELLFNLWDAALSIPTVVCVEHDGRIDEILKHPSADLYTEVHRNPENLILSRSNQP